MRGIRMKYLYVAIEFFLIGHANDGHALALYEIGFEFV